MRTPKGTRVFYPDDAERRLEIESRIENTIRGYGFDNVRSPALEESETYKEKSGEEIVEQLFLLDEDVGNKQLTLMPELTPTVGRMVAEKQQQLKQPIKWYSTRRFWRYEAVQQGRFREFWQTNVDIFGVDEPYGEIELIEMVTDALSELDISSNQVSIRISDRRVLESLVNEFVTEDNNEEVMRIVDKSEKLEPDEYKERLKSSGVSDVEEFVRLQNISDPESLEDEFGSVAEPLSQLFEYLENKSSWLELDISTARGLDYYTGVVFEGFDTTGQVSRSLLGGGRYDNLVENYNGNPMPAVGLAFGYATLEEALESYGITFKESNSPDMYVIRFEDTAEVSRDVARTLRNRGFTVSRSLGDRSIGSQFGVADEKSADYAVVPGPDEVSSGEVQVQDLKTGEKVNVEICEIQDVEFDELFR